MAVPALLSFLAFDRIVRVEYQSHRKDWETDNKPLGIFWVPSEAQSLAGWAVKFDSWVASRRCALVWLIRTPNWAVRDKTALRLFFWWRLLVAIWLTMFGGMIVIFVFALTIN